MTDQALQDACANEPIRIPGAVQPHGVLLAVREPDLMVVIASQNASSMFRGEVVGRSLEELLPPTDATRLRAGLAGDLAEINPLRMQVGPIQIDVVMHRADGLLVTEWEPRPAADPAGPVWYRRLPSVLQRMSGVATLDGLVAVLASDTRRLTGFDRVMVYRFDADWNGEVIAEDRREDLEPFLGLRYPASDIPAQARALYTTNWSRLIPDATYRPVPLVPSVHPETGSPLDLSSSMLRSVSPVHLEYLRNMGVMASMSVSLIDRGRLWGLVACHHYDGTHRPSYTDRTAAEFLARTASLLLPTAVDGGANARVVDVAQRQAQLASAVSRLPRAPISALTDGDVTVLDLLPCGGAAVRLDGRLVLLGSTPRAERVMPLVTALLAGESAASRLCDTDALHTVLPDHADLADRASGVLTVEIGSGSGNFLAWFRPENIREVSWAGNPHTSKVTEGEQGPRLSPRQSFARWSETVRGTAIPWQEHELAAARSLAMHLEEAALTRADEDNRLAATLQRTLLLEQLPQVPGVVLAARYTASANDVVGGDWYDLILLPSGRVSIVLGDVAGHGLTAASVTAQLRHALRAHLLRDRGPAAALQSLNELVAMLLPGEMATAIVAELDPNTGQVAVATAGHPPVLLTAAAGARYLDEERGPALGVIDTAGYGETRLQLADDDRLLLYSDGLIERRRVDLQDGFDRLRITAESSSADPDTLLDDVLAVLAPPNDDDVTLVAIGLAR